MKAKQGKLHRVIEDMAAKVVQGVTDGSVIGLGSGSTVAVFVRKLGRRAAEEGLTFAIIPSSLQIQLVAEQSGLNILPLKMIPKIDITVDGADQIDEDFNMIKGGGGALYRERILLRAAKKSTILADETKYAKRLCRPIPIETSFFARSSVYEKLVKMGGKPTLRLLDKGYPFTTENGNVILDTDFGVVEKPEIMRSDITDIAGVIEAGIFVGECDVFYRANRDGSVQIFEVR
ncbi:MAG: ribose-5-phosphate isomerase RpiA [Nitrososphaerales archaeon]